MEVGALVVSGLAACVACFAVACGGAPGSSGGAPGGRSGSGPSAALADEATIVEGEERARSLAVDGCCVYWLAAGGGTDGHLRKVDKAGGRPATMITWPGAHRIAIGGEAIYATVPKSSSGSADGPYRWGSVWEEVRSITTGCGAERLVVKDQLGFADTAAANIAADPAGLYFIHAAEPAVLFLPLGEEDARLVAFGRDASPSANELHGPYVDPVLRGIAINGRHVVWAGESLRLAPKAGGPVRELSANVGAVVAIAADERSVFVARAPRADSPARGPAEKREGEERPEGRGSLLAVPLEGGPAEEVGSFSLCPPTEPCSRGIGLALDATHVYWTSPAEGAVLRAPKRGGAPEVIASGQARPEAVAVDETGVFWLNRGSAKSDFRDGSVRKRSK